jgi:hypothetical protein
MSTFRNPVGPQPRSVYWRRRLVVLLGLVAVIALVVFLITRPGSGEASSGTPTPTPTQDAESTAEPEPEPSATPEEESVEGADCDPANVVVEAITDKASYAAGEKPQLSFSITNTSVVACTFNVGTTQQLFTVSSGADQFWSSKDCETDAVDAAILLEPNLAQSSAPIAWDRTRSSVDTCDSDRPAAPAGGATFSLNVTVGAASPAVPTSFLLY